MKMASAKNKTRFPTTRIEVKSAIILSTWMSCQLAMTWKCGKRQARNMAVDVVATHGNKGSCMRPKPGTQPCMFFLSRREIVLSFSKAEHLTIDISQYILVVLVRLHVCIYIYISIKYTYIHTHIYI